MGNTQTATTLFSCSVENCRMGFSSQKELISHEEECHGELRRCRQAGCEYPVAGSADEHKGQLVKELSEKGLEITQ
jgi:hypothetical protein